jgi:large subunit ribosomal protein L13
MKVQIQKTHFTTPDEIDRKWFVVDAQGKTLGRLATEVAKILRGKHKPQFVPNLDVGDFVIVVNVEKIHVTGKRLDQKIYWRHSGYPGGIKSQTLREVLNKYPERAIKSAVKGMLPKGPLGRQMLTKLKLYAGSEHPHEAQKPEVLEL